MNKLTVRINLTNGAFLQVEEVEELFIPESCVQIEAETKIFIIPVERIQSVEAAYND